MRVEKCSRGSGSHCRPRSSNTPVHPREPGERLSNLRLETVTLFNVTAESINLNSWAITDRLKHKSERAGSVLDPGETVRVTLDGQDAQLSKGGIITLLDPDRRKVDGVSFTKRQAKEQDGTVVF